ncbi:glycosyltransferase family 2 protein [Magnetococcales bacterium HHB-1]
MARLPKISIVTPSYNQAAFIEKTLCSVLEQDYPDLEYIVMDGGSTDGSVEIIEKYADRLAYWISEKDRGQSHAINKGWQRATGEIFAYLNTDDTLLPGALKRIGEAFLAHPEAVCCFGDCDVLSSEQYLYTAKTHATGFRRLAMFGQVRYLQQPASFFRGETVRQIGYVNESLHLAMDYDLFLRLAAQGPFVSLSVPVATALLHTDAKTFTNMEAHWRERLKVAYTHGGWLAIGQLPDYFKYRLLNALPKSLQYRIRKIRGNPQDHIIARIDRT